MEFLTFGNMVYHMSHVSQVGYMNDGTILAADITYYSNGGCTLDESSFVCYFSLDEKKHLHLVI